MRVLLVNDYGVEVGGAEHYFFELGAALRAQGHQVMLLSSDRLRGGRQLRADRVIGHSGHWLGLDSLFHPGNFGAFRRAEEEFRPDVIHFNNLSYALSTSVIFSAKAPAVLTLHDYFGICLGDRRKRSGEICRENFLDSHCRGGCGKFSYCSLEHLRRAIFRRAAQRLKTLISPCQYLKTQYERCGYQRVLHVPHPFPAISNQRENREGFLYVGRFEEQKGVKELIYLYRRYLELGGMQSLRLVGRGAERDYLQAEIAQHSLQGKVEIIDWVDHQKLRKLYSSHLALILPSRWPEVGPLVMFEALSCALPIVARSVGGVPEVVKDRENGLLYLQDEELPERLLLAEQLAAELTAGARESADLGLDFKGHVCRLEEIYRQAQSA